MKTATTLEHSAPGARKKGEKMVGNKAILVRLEPKLAERLEKYRNQKYGSHRSLSIVVERAIKEFLDREEKVDKL